MQSDVHHDVGDSDNFFAFISHFPTVLVYFHFICAACNEEIMYTPETTPRTFFFFFFFFFFFYMEVSGAH